MYASATASPTTPATVPAATLQLLCALLRGETPAWPSSATEETIAAFLRSARYHGVTPLLDARFKDNPASTWPEAIRRACHEDALVQSMSELLQRTELVRVLAELATAGISSLLLKGTALAYSRYPSPMLRPRADCDLLVTPSDCNGAVHCLQNLGYRRVSGPAGTYVGYQFEMARTEFHGTTHNIDLHSRISNAQSFAWLFTFDELAVASVSVEDLGPNARRLGDVHALVLALLHRVGNNVFVAADFGDRLIWLYDIHLLVEAMPAADLAHFRQVVESKQVVAIAIEGLRRCAESFHSPSVAALAAELEHSEAASSGARLLGARGWHREWLEFCAVPTPAARMQYVAARIFPSAEYLHDRLPDDAEGTLPALHARRWFRGLGARLTGRNR